MPCRRHSAVARMGGSVQEEFRGLCHLGLQMRTLKHREAKQLALPARRSTPALDSNPIGQHWPPPALPSRDHGLLGAAQMGSACDISGSTWICLLGPKTPPLPILGRESVSTAPAGLGGAFPDLGAAFCLALCTVAVTRSLLVRIVFTFLFLNDSYRFLFD